MNQLPEKWTINKLKDITNYVDYRGKTPPKTTEGVFLVTAKNVKDGHIDYEISQEYISTDAYQEVMRRGKPRIGDVLITTEAPLGNVACIDREDIALAQRVIKLRGKQEFIINAFLKYYLLSPKFQKELEEKATGSTAKGIKGSVLHEMPLIIPPLSEQKAIASCLSTWDEAIQKTSQLIAQKELRKKWLMQQLLTGKKRLKGFSGEWEEITLGELADKNKKWSFTGGPFGSNLKAEDYTANGVRIIQLQNIGDGTFNDNYKIYTSQQKADELLSCNIYPGEIIISKMGDPVARACFMPMGPSRYLMASDGIRLAIDEQAFNKKFILDYINFDIFRKKAIETSTGSTRQRIGLDDLRKLTLTIPTLEEQTAIANILQTADKEIELLKTKLLQLKEQKKGLMQVLLTGKKRLKL